MRRTLAIADPGPRWAMKKAAAVGLSTAIAIGAIVLAMKEERANRAAPAAATVRAAPVDPLAAEFARCQALGEAGAHDAGCLAAWAENRRRFLMLDRRPMAPVPPAHGAR